MLRRTKIITGVAAAVVAVCGAGAGVAAAADQPSSPAPTAAQTTAQTTQQQPDQGKKHPQKRRLLGRVAHGEVTLNGKQHRVIDLQRGDVTAVSPTSISVRSTDGFSATYTVNPQTKVRHDKQAGQVGDVHVGDKVQVVATKDGSTLTAKRIGDRGAGK